MLVVSVGLNLSILNDFRLFILQNTKISNENAYFGVFFHWLEIENW